MIQEATVEERAVEYAATGRRPILRELSDAEVASLARKAAEKECEARNEEMAAEARSSDAKEAKRLAQYAIEAARGFLQQVNTGTRYESIECGIVKDVKTNRVGFFRIDTGEVVEVSAMSGDDRQLTLDDAAAPEPTTEQLAKLDAWEAEHGRMAATGEEAGDVIDAEYEDAQEADTGEDTYDKDQDDDLDEEESS